MQEYCYCGANLSHCFTQTLDFDAYLDKDPDILCFILQSNDGSESQVSNFL